MKKETHFNYVTDLAASSGDRIFSVDWDDSLKSVDVIAKTFTDDIIKTDNQPKKIIFSNDLIVLVTHRGLEVFNEGFKQRKVKTDFSSSSIATSDTRIAVEEDDNKLHIYSISLSLHKEIFDISSLITAPAFSPRGDFLTIKFSSGRISVCSCDD